MASTDDEYIPSDTSDKEYIPPKSKRKTKSKQKRKRTIIDSSDEDETNHNANKPLRRKKKKKLSKQLTNNNNTNMQPESINTKKRNRNEFENENNTFQDDEIPSYFPSIDEMAENIEQYEMDMIQMADMVEMEYKANNSNNNNNNTQCQESECNSVTICPMYLKHFGIYVCKECKWKSKYKCITKTNAKKQYLLSEGDINALKCWIKNIRKKNEMFDYEKNNNNNNKWIPKYLKLYLIYQLEELALEKYGSKEGIEQERNKREANKMQRSISNARKKRKIKFECLDDIEIDKNVVDQHNSKTHIHKFGASQCVNEETDEWNKTCIDCGYVESWEEF
eukprot:23315_1